MRLVHPTHGVFVFEDPVVAQSLQDSGAEAAEVMMGRPGADGVDDETRFVRRRALTLAVRIFDRPPTSRTESWDRLQRFLHPRDRVTLIDGTECGLVAERQILVRRQQAPRSIENPIHSDHAVSWVSVEPYWRAMATQTVELEPGVGSTTGRIYPLVYPRLYAAGVPVGVVVANSSGSAPATLVTRIYGPCTAPSVRSLTNGGRLDFPTLTIDAGAYLELDSAGQTVRMNGDPAANRLHLLDFPTAVWFGIEPGLNELRFVVGSSGVGCRAEFVWQDHYL